MAAVLILSNGTDSIDFMDGAEKLRVRRDGVDLPPPDPIRITGGAPPLRDGSALLGRRYANREIVIRFKVESQTHDATVAAIQKLQRLLDHAVHAQEQRGLLPGVALEFKLENQTSSVFFDVLDGEIRLGGPLNQLLKREGPYIDNELSLVCRPYARGPVVRLENFLDNSGFDHNGVQSALDAGYYYTFGTAGQRLENSAVTGLVPTGNPTLFCHAIVYPEQDDSGDEEIILKASEAWSLTWTPSDKRFRLHVSDGVSPAVAASVAAFPKNAWYTVTGLCVLHEGEVDQKSVLLIVNGKVVGESTYTFDQMDQTPGAFTVGADDLGNSRFRGRVAGAAVLTRNMWPWQAKLLHDYGLRSLVPGEAGDLAGTPPGYDFWNLSDSDYGAVWMFDQASGTIFNFDLLGGPHLTNIGSMTGTEHAGYPLGWNALPAGIQSGRRIVLSKDKTKYGRFSCQFQRTSGTSALVIFKMIQIPLRKRGASANRDWNLLFYAAAAGPTNQDLPVSVVGDVSGSLLNDEITLTETVTQYGVKITHGIADTQITVIFGDAIPSGELRDVHVANVQLIPGNPFSPETSIGVLSEEIPYVSSRRCRAVEGSGKNRYLEIRNLPGDAPAPVRVFVRNPGVE